MFWIAISAILITLYNFAEICCYMYAEHFEKSLPYQLARFFKLASWVWEPASAGCKRCGIPTRLVDFHDIRYKEWCGPNEYGQLEFFPDSIVVGGSRSLTIFCEHCSQESSQEELLSCCINFLGDHTRDLQDQQLIIDAVLAGK